MQCLRYFWSQVAQKTMFYVDCCFIAFKVRTKWQHVLWETAAKEVFHANVSTDHSILITTYWWQHIENNIQTPSIISLLHLLVLIQWSISVSSSYTVKFAVRNVIELTVLYNFKHKHDYLMIVWWQLEHCPQIGDIVVFTTVTNHDHQQHVFFN